MRMVRTVSVRVPKATGQREGETESSPADDEDLLSLR